MTDHQTLPNLAQYSFASNFYTLSDGLRMHYVDEGSGPTVLMVHGNPSWSYLYRRLISGLSSRFRCIAPDHIGMGFSSRPQEGQYPFRLERRAEDLGALVEFLNLEGPVHLVVHDWGGAIGLSWALRRPELLASVIVLNSAIRQPQSYHLPLRLGIFKKMERMGHFLAVKHNLFVQGTTTFGVVKKMSPELRHGFTAPYETPERRLAIGAFVADIPMEPSHPSYGYLAETDRLASENLPLKPMSLLWGLKDFVFTRKMAQDWVDRFSHMETHFFPAAGHYILEDEPQEAVRRIGRFLEGLQNR